MTITEVKTKSDAQAFLEMPFKIYKNDQFYVRPLDKDINSVFDPKYNKLYRNGECARFIAWDDKGNSIGRIAAFINKKTANKEAQPTGGVGFFESIDDKEVSKQLFDTCKDWLQERGMEAMDGPINFGDRDRWWGLMVDGYDEPVYGMNYNPTYYYKLFEAYGFKTYYKQFVFAWPMDTELPQVMKDKAERIARDPAYSFRHIDKNQLDKYAEDFRTIYNKAWVKHQGVAEMPKQQARLLFKSMKPVIDENIVWYGYYNDEPVSFFIMLPELNQLFKYVNGKMDLIGKLKFLWYRWRGACRKMFGVLFGVVPEHQAKGVEGAMVIASAKHILPMNKYDMFEMNWIGDFNGKMLKLCESLNAYVSKTYITYRFLFDETKEFKRHPMLD